MSWRKDKSGVAAVEFSLVAIPFVLIIVGIIEMSLMFAAQSLLHESTFTAARLIRTGQIQTGGGNPQQVFRDAVCDFSSMMIPCNEIQFQVQQIPSFGDAEDIPPAEFDENGNMANTGFDPGGVSDVILIRVSYNYNIITPMMQPLLTNRAGGSRIMLSTIVLQNEPYQFEEE